MTKFLKFKLKPDFVRRLERAAHRRGIAVSAFAREAIESAIQDSERAPTRLEFVRDLIGKYDLKGENLSLADAGIVARQWYRRQRREAARIFLAKRA